MSKEDNDCFLDGGKSRAARQLSITNELVFKVSILMILKPAQRHVSTSCLPM